MDEVVAFCWVDVFFFKVIFRLSLLISGVDSLPDRRVLLLGFSLGFRTAKKTSGSLWISARILSYTYTPDV